MTHKKHKKHIKKHTEKEFYFYLKFKPIIAKNNLFVFKISI